MPAFPEAFIDDVASGVQRDYQAGRERRNMVADSAIAGYTSMTESLRLQNANDGRLTGAVVAQALLGTNQYSANDIVAMNSAAREPFTAPQTPLAGPGTGKTTVTPGS